MVLGAGATGLAAAAELSRQGMAVTVVEADRVSIGGRSRTLEFMGCRFDIGPQPLVSADPEVTAFFTGQAGDHLTETVGRARILNRGRYLEAPTGSWDAMLSLGPVEAVRCLLSLGRARLDPIAVPVTLEDLARNQLGSRAFFSFYAAYFEKVWGLAAAQLYAEAPGGLAGAPAGGARLVSISPARYRPAMAVRRRPVGEFGSPGAHGSHPGCAAARPRASDRG